MKACAGRPPAALPLVGGAEDGLGPRRARRGVRRVLLPLLTSVLLALVAAPAAFAHATLVGSEPAAGSVVPRTPGRVTARFDEAVSTTAGALTVFDPAGKRVDDGALARPGARAVSVGLPESLPPGTYTVAWRVTSADTHVVHGAFTFSVGRRSAGTAATRALLEGGGTPLSVSVPFGVVRFACYLLLLVAGGGALALALVLRGEAGSARRRVALGLVPVGALLALLSAGGLVFEAAESNGTTLGGALHGSLLAQVRDSHFGRLWLSRGWLALAFAVLAAAYATLGARRRAAAGAGLVVLAGGLVVTTSLAGHADVAGAGALAADAAHVAAAAVWVGGLAAVALALVLAGAEGRWPLAAVAVPRYSQLAVAAVAALVAAGVANAWLEIGAWRGLWQTTYGQLVLVKVGLLLPLLGLGAFNNRISVPGLRAAAPAPRLRRRFLGAVAAELALLALVLGVTAVLVDERPAKSALARVAAPATVTAVTAVGPYRARVEVKPAAAGANTIEVALTAQGRAAADVAEVDVQASLPKAGIGPSRHVARKLGGGRFVVDGARLAIAGSWRLTLQVRRGEFDEWLGRVVVRIRGAA